MNTKSNKKAQNPLSSIFVDCWAGMDDQFYALTKALRKKHDSVFTFLVSSPKRKAVIEKWCKPNDLIVVESDQVVLSGADIGTLESSLTKASMHESFYSVNYMKDIIFPDRSLSCNFKVYADTSLFNHLAKFDSNRVISQINYSFDFYSRLFKERAITFVLAQPSGHLFSPMIFVAKKNNAKITFPMSSRIDTLYSFGPDEFMGNRWIKAEFNRQKQLRDDPVRFEPRQLMAKHINQAIATTSLKFLVSQCCKATVNRIIFLVRDLKSFRLSKRASFASVLHNLFSKWKISTWLVKNSSGQIDKERCQKVLTFFLPTEPEVTTNHYNKEFNNTLAFIQQLSASTPINCKIYVKEHYSNIGNRSKNFYEKMLSLPNVELLDFRLSGPSVLQRTDLVATVNGTVGIEAACLGLPVIVLSKHTQYNFLKNVFEVDDLFRIERTLETALSDFSTKDRQAWKDEAHRYLRAVKNISYDVPSSKEQGLTGEMPDEEADKAIGLLEKLAFNRI